MACKCRGGDEGQWENSKIAVDCKWRGDEGQSVGEECHSCGLSVQRR